MLLPSRHLEAARARPWSIPRALAYGAVIGMLAATVKNFSLARDPFAHAGNLAGIAGAALGFALLCAGAAAARNFIARRLIGRDAK